ncbi:uncharacterized protein A4U43_C05F30550 [Asparagus officinalis]|uniref:DNA-directed RNA polymerase subunit n=1 Tax=Asparagus officinalis TaxID=4686 RepID=A0A5P1EVM1_ASPOF|nr:uncharacterized protein A4U43_C05F30550 [Asparagus officinalis]
MATTSEAPSEFVKSVKFSFYSPEDVRNLSVKRITSPELLDAKGLQVPDGFYDPALGPINEIDSCKTCGQLAYKCPGHCGHIELVKPVFNPLQFNSLKSLLHITCFFCHRFRFSTEKVQHYVAKLTHIAKGDILAAKDLDSSSVYDIIYAEDSKEKNITIHPCESGRDSKNAKDNSWTSLQYVEAISALNIIMKNRPKKCANCGKSNLKISSPTFGWLSKTVKHSDITANFIRESNVGLPSTGEEGPANEGDDAPQSDGKSAVPTYVSDQSRNLSPDFFKSLNASAGQKHLVPSEVELILDGLWRNEFQLCRLICDIQQKDLKISGNNKWYAMFFLKALLVPPSKFRPPAFSGRGVVEHPQNLLLRKVQECNIVLRELIKTDPNNPKIIERWTQLQRSVSVLFDSSKGLAKSERETNGIRQLLEKKAGILRQKMMGKRVNFACRSVISPDPYLAVNEIGIPPYFALKLTYPERVTPWNADKLKHSIMNGANIHPGATHYMDKDRLYKLQVSENMRKAISRKLPTSRGVTLHSGKGPEYDFEGKVVYRHIQDGDIVLVNRQPTLHKPSMMAHVVRVLNGEKTLRMHYANCRLYTELE